MNKRINLQISNSVKKIARWILSGFLVMMIWGMVTYTVSIIIESGEEDEYSWLLKDLNRGDYADCAEYYTTLLHLGDIDAEEYAQFDEFECFYSDYILCVEYKGAKEPEKYQAQVEECIANMEQIYENTIYSDNIPHYEYLLECAKVVD